MNICSQLGTNNYCDPSNANFNVSGTSPATTTTSITVLSPNGGERLQIGQSYEIRWSNQTDQAVSLALVDTSLPVDYAVSFESGLPKTGASAGATSYLWTVPSNAIPKSTYKIRIGTATEAYLYDNSDSTFTIAAATSTNP